MSLRAAYVTTYDSRDPHAWSGLGLHIARCLQLAGLAVEHIGPLERHVPGRARVYQVAGKLQGKRYALERDPTVARAYAAQVDRRLEAVRCDLVFSPGTLAIAYLNSDRPVAIWADATFAAFLRAYPDFGPLSARAIRAGMDLERRGLARADVAFYASTWAARSAVEDHGADPEKVEVVPFGANLAIEHDRDAVVEFVGRRPTECCRLLFVGVDWVRKGGDRAVEIAVALNERGLPTELDVVGCTPNCELPEWVRVHGFVDKTTPSGAASLRNLYERSHVLVHPATAECFGVVFCEAAAHGVPSVASRVDGIPSAVRDGVSGTLFDVDAPAAEYADHISRLLDDRAAYEESALRAFDEYSNTLSWEAQAKRIGSRLAELV